jgi:hypothetical protein
MAAKPLPMTGPSNEVDIDQNGIVTGSMTVNNGGLVKFDVTSYPTDPNTGQPYNQCMVTIGPGNISWATVSQQQRVATGFAGTSTIKVGQ